MQRLQRIVGIGAQRLLLKPPRPARFISRTPDRGSLARFMWVAGGGAMAIAGALYFARRSTPQRSAACAEKPPPPPSTPASSTTADTPPGSVVEGLPSYSFEEVSKHVTREGGGRIWVTYKDGVYDITEFAPRHPGGEDKILMARGGAIDPYWDVLQVHAAGEAVHMLETMRVGNVCAEDRAKRRAAVEAAIATKREGPYAGDPRRSPILKVNTSEPFNAETPPPFLVDGYTTPQDIFFVRNHLPVPAVEPGGYALEVCAGEGLVPIHLSLNDLKTKFEQVTVTSSIQCTGNRRTELQAVKPIKGLPWGVGAIGTAEWKGVWLRDVLAHAGLKDSAGDSGHVHLEGLDQNVATGECYGASIPLQKALDRRGDCLLAYAMNGEELSRDHGYPLRAVVPGVTGARNVKWLKKITVSSSEYGGFWQQKDYKSFPPSVDWDNVDFSKAPAIQETPVQSAICSPQDGSVLHAWEEDITLRGYAYSGGGRGIIRVDVSADGGRTWQEATLLPGEGAQQDPYRAWAWVLWEAHVHLPPLVAAKFGGDLPAEGHSDGQQLELCCRAVDRSYNTQPEYPAPIWNLRGVLANSWHRIHLQRPRLADEPVGNIVPVVQ